MKLSLLSLILSLSICWFCIHFSIYPIVSYVMWATPLLLFSKPNYSKMAWLFSSILLLIIVVFSVYSILPKYILSVYLTWLFFTFVSINCVIPNNTNRINLYDPKTGEYMGFVDDTDEDVELEQGLKDASEGKLFKRRSYAEFANPMIGVPVNSKIDVNNY